MSNALEQSFVGQLKENQNIIHKICRLYTQSQDEHNDLFQEITIQLWKAFPSFGVIASSLLGHTEWH